MAPRSLFRCTRILVTLFIWSDLIGWIFGSDCIPSSRMYLGRDNAEVTGNRNEINVTVLLPFDYRYMASVRRTGPAIQLGFEKVKELQLLPRHTVHLTFIDSNCSNIIAPMEAMRSKFNNAVDVFFGPSCELALGKTLTTFPSDSPLLQSLISKYPGNAFKAEIFQTE